MIQLQSWPPPRWTQCVVTWEWLLGPDKPPIGTIDAMYKWCNDHPSDSRWHVFGWRATEGFAFCFEDPRDAIMFKLRWPAK